MPDPGGRIVVTGAGSGIGLAIADRLAASGSEVIRLDAQEDAGAHRLDVTSAEDWDGLDAGGVTGLVHAAGIRSRGSLADTDEADFRRVLDVNVTGTFLALRWVARNARTDPGMAVVTLTSAVVQHTVENQAAYNASKAAIASLTRSAARELAERNVRVNAIAPGSVLTPMTSDGWADEQHAQRMRGEIPMGRPGAPEEVASVAAFLLAPESAYVTGAVWTVDGGWTA